MLVISAVDWVCITRNSRSRPMQPPRSYAAQLNHVFVSPGRSAATPHSGRPTIYSTVIKAGLVPLSRVERS